MRLGLRLAIAAVAGLGLVGCGGAKIGSREEAAAVVHTAGSKGQLAANSGSLMKLLQSGAGGVSISLDCSRGGTVQATVDFTDILQGAEVRYTLSYDRCTEPVYDDPETTAVEREDVTYDGTITLAYKVEGSGTGASAVMTYKGRVDLSGALSDFVEADVTETVSTQFSGTSASMTFTLSGSVKTSGETYTYANETYTLTAEGRVQSTPGA